MGERGKQFLYWHFGTPETKTHFVSSFHTSFFLGHNCKRAPLRSRRWIMNSIIPSVHFSTGAHRRAHPTFSLSIYFFFLILFMCVEEAKRCTHGVVLAYQHSMVWYGMAWHGFYQRSSHSSQIGSCPFYRQCFIWVFLCWIVDPETSSIFELFTIHA